MEREGEHNWLPLMQDELTAWAPGSLIRWLSFGRFRLQPLPASRTLRRTPAGILIMRAYFARCGITPNLKFSTMDSLATYSMVEAGLGVSMNNAINGRAWSGKVRILPLRSAADG